MKTSRRFWGAATAQLQRVLSTSAAAALRNTGNGGAGGAGGAGGGGGAGFGKKKGKLAPLQERKMVDRFRLHVHGGHGGAGCSSFRKGRQSRHGFADGGNGGRGGDVVLVGSSAVWDLSNLQHHLNGRSGGQGGSKKRVGSRGVDKIVQVPVGTVIHLVRGAIPSLGAAAVPTATFVSEQDADGFEASERSVASKISLALELGGGGRGREGLTPDIHNSELLAGSSPGLSSPVFHHEGSEGLPAVSHASLSFSPEFSGGGRARKGPGLDAVGFGFVERADLVQDFGSGADPDVLREEGAETSADALNPLPSGKRSDLLRENSAEDRSPSSVLSENGMNPPDDEVWSKDRLSEDDQEDLSDDDDERRSEVLESVAEFTSPGQSITVAQGGSGGKGNAAVARGAGSDKSLPSLDHELGDPGTEADLILELKAIADVGLVGAPNAGKSTLLGALSKAKPACGHYKFTTLRPNIGMVEFDDFYGLTVADIPGLLPGAHQNRGLGHTFLRHIERTKVLAYVIDLAGGLGFDTGPKPWDQVESLMFELEQYQAGLSRRPAVIVANKIDEEGAISALNTLREKVPGLDIFPVCAVLDEGVEDLKLGIRKLVESIAQVQENSSSNRREM